MNGTWLALAVGATAVAATAVSAGSSRRGGTGSRAGIVEVRPLSDILDQLHALERLYRSLHWQASGPSSYGDHLLYDRLYKSLPEEIDRLGERIVGLSGRPDDVQAVSLQMRSAKLLSRWTDEIPIGIARAIFAEKALIAMIVNIATDPGTENLLQSIADKHQEHLYLLGRRVVPAGSRARKVEKVVPERLTDSYGHTMTPSQYRVWDAEGRPEWPAILRDERTGRFIVKAYRAGYMPCSCRDCFEGVIGVPGDRCDDCSGCAGGEHECLAAGGSPARTGSACGCGYNGKADGCGSKAKRDPVDPATMTAGEINRELDRIAEVRDQIGDELIAAGRGYEKSSETWAKTDPIALRFQAIGTRAGDLHAEIERRYGPRAPVRLPLKGFGPRKKKGSAAMGSRVRKKPVSWASVADGETTLLGGEPSLVSDDALVAVLLDQTTGRHDPGRVARDVVRASDDDLFRLTGHDFAAEVEGLSRSGRARLLASGEVVRRGLHRAQMVKLQPIRSPRDVVSYVEAAAIGPYESLLAVFLNRRMVPRGLRILTKGSDAFTVVDPRQVFRAAIAAEAVSVILVHNHPSGDPTPSQQDRDVTRRVAAASRVVGIPLLDHIVVAAGGKYVSLADQGELPSYGEPGPAWTA